MQKPSWVRSPSSYTEGSSSSLIVAFKDPDRQHLKLLLAAWYLFAFGTRASVKTWKQRATKCQNNSDQLEHRSRRLDTVLRSGLQPPVFAHTVFHTDVP